MAMTGVLWLLPSVLKVKMKLFIQANVDGVIIYDSFSPSMVTSQDSPAKKIQ